MHKTFIKFSEESAKEMRRIFSESSEVKELVQSVAKELTDEQKAELGTFEMVITTEDFDRYGESISLDGWDFSHYLKNGVVLWGHDHYGLPIGVTTEIEKKDGKVIARGYFASAEMNPFAQQIRRLYDAGIVRASSVGLLVHERNGNIIVKAELLEWSFVTVPANPQALTLAANELDMSPKAVLSKGFFTEKDAENPEGEEDDADPDMPPEDVIDEEEKGGDIMEGKTKEFSPEQKTAIEATFQALRQDVDEMIVKAMTTILGDTPESESEEDEEEDDEVEEEGKKSDAGDLSKAKEVINIDSKGAESDGDQKKRSGYLESDADFRKLLKTINTLTRQALTVQK